MERVVLRGEHDLGSPVDVAARRGLHVHGVGRGVVFVEDIVAIRVDVRQREIARARGGVHADAEIALEDDVVCGLQESGSLHCFTSCGVGGHGATVEGNATGRICRDVHPKVAHLPSREVGDVDYLDPHLSTESDDDRDAARALLVVNSHRGVAVRGCVTLEDLWLAPDEREAAALVETDPA